MFSTKRSSRDGRRNHASRDRFTTLCGIALSALDRYSMYASDCRTVDCDRCRRSLEKEGLL